MHLTLNSIVIAQESSHTWQRNSQIIWGNGATDH